MKASRGRFSLYKILCTDAVVKKYLVKTEKLSKESLTRALQTKKPIKIKAMYGTEEMAIIPKNGEYFIEINNKKIIVKDLETLYNSIQNEILQPFCMIQQSPMCQNPCRYYLTLHRKSASAKWTVVFKTKSVGSIFQKLRLAVHFIKIKSIAKRAATLLGKSFPDCRTIVLNFAYDFKGDFCMDDYVLHFSNSKWSQYHTLRKNIILRKYLPQTDLLTEQTFHDYLQRYSSIFLKPCIGQNGNGIIQVQKKSKTTYEIHAGVSKITKVRLNDAYQYIKEKYLTHKSYLIQQTIPLATIDHCPIDVRVVTQKVNRKWIITGKIAKVAGKQFIITNAAQKLLTLSQAIQEAGLSHIHLQYLDSRLNKLCLLAAKILEKSNDKQTYIVGFDIGITERGALRIIEGNAVPDINMFRQLEDQTMYQTIKTIRNTKK